MIDIDKNVRYAVKSDTTNYLVLECSITVDGETYTYDSRFYTNSINEGRFLLARQALLDKIGADKTAEVDALLVLYYDACYDDYANARRNFED